MSRWLVYIGAQEEATVTQAAGSVSLTFSAGGRDWVIDEADMDASPSLDGLNDMFRMKNIPFRIVDTNPSDVLERLEAFR